MLIYNGKEYDIPREVLDLYEKVYDGTIGDRVENNVVLKKDFEFINGVIDIIEKKYGIGKCKKCDGKRPLDKKGMCLACRIAMENRGNSQR